MGCQCAKSAEKSNMDLQTTNAPPKSVVVAVDVMIYLILVTRRK